MDKNNIRQKISEIFEFPTMKMPWTLYFAQLNEAGKITERSILETITVILEDLEQLEKATTDLTEKKV